MDGFNPERARRSFEIIGHDNTTCPDCKGAAFGHHDHYALGKLRQAIGMELGLPFPVVMGLDIKTLMEKRAERRAQPA